MDAAVGKELSLIPGTDLRRLSQLVPESGYRGISDRTRNNAQAPEIERLLQKAPSGAIKVCYEKRVPWVRIQLMPFGTAELISDLKTLGKKEKDLRMISPEDEEILCQFLVEIGFVEQSTDHETKESRIFYFPKQGV